MVLSGIIFALARAPWLLVVAALYNAAAAQRWFVKSTPQVCTHGRHAYC